MERVEEIDQRTVELRGQLQQLGPRPDIDAWQAEADRLRDVLDAVAVQDARRHEHHPPDWLVDKIGQPPEQPEARSLWRDAAGRIQAFRTRWQIDDPQHPYGDVLAASDVQRRDRHNLDWQLRGTVREIDTLEHPDSWSQPRPRAQPMNSRVPIPIALACIESDTYPGRVERTMWRLTEMGETLVGRARRLAGLTQEEIAERAGTSRPNVSAYEHGSRAPNLRTLQRLVDAAGYRLGLEPTPGGFERAGTYRGAWVLVPRQLPRLELERAFARVELPVHLDWSSDQRIHDLSDRSDRRRVYELVLREGTPEDVLRFVDGALLVDMWDELALPDEIRTAWQPLIDDVAGERMKR